MSVVNFLEVLDRAHTGPVCKVRDWDTKVIPRKAAEKLKEYGLERTCDPKNPVNTDDSLADEFWKAGFDMAVDVGVLCVNTERVIKFTEEELKTALRDAPSEVTFGTGLYKVTIEARKPEDKKRPTTFFGPFGTAISEELWIPGVAATAQYKSNDIVMAATPLTVYGREIKGGTPYEVLAGKWEAVMYKEVVRRVNRPGMPTSGIGVTDATGLATLGGHGIPGGLDPSSAFVVALPPSDLKTNYYLLNKTAQSLNCGGVGVLSAGYSMIGGYAGGPEASAVSATAFLILQAPVHQATLLCGQVYDLRDFGGSSRECIWANSVATQAQSRNTDVLVMTAVNQVAGPCTDMVLYETAAQCIGHVASGAALVMGSRPRAGRYPHYFSGLENLVACEVAKACAGMKRSDANKIVKDQVAKYEDRLSDPPIGKKFEECTDVKTLKPTQEWLNIYKKVKKELIDLGFPYKY